MERRACITACLIAACLSNQAHAAVRSARRAALAARRASQRHSAVCFDLLGELTPYFRSTHPPGSPARAHGWRRGLHPVWPSHASLGWCWSASLFFLGARAGFPSLGLLSNPSVSTNWPLDFHFKPPIVAAQTDTALHCFPGCFPPLRLALDRTALPCTVAVRRSALFICLLGV